MKTTIAIALGIFSVFTASAAQPSENMDLLLKARVLQCNFDEGHSTSWDSGRAKIKSDSFKSVGTVTFDNINLPKKTARFVGNNGANDVVAFTTGSATHFYEETAMGNVAVTTVFPHLDKDGRFIAVTSRHMAMASPHPAQYQGTCAGR